MDISCVAADSQGLVAELEVKEAELAKALPGSPMCECDRGSIDSDVECLVGLEDRTLP